MEPALKEKLRRQMEKSRKKLAAARAIFAQELYDDAISRAYYAMFHAAKALLFARNIEVRTHHGLISQLSKHFVAENVLEVSLLKSLTYAKDLRENGDYDSAYEASREEAQLILTDAKTFVDKIDSLLKNQYGIE